MARTLPNANRIIRSFIAALLGTVMVATVATGQEKVKFPIGVGTKTLGTSMYWLAAKKGFFDEVGLEVLVEFEELLPCVCRVGQLVDLFLHQSALGG